MAITSFHFKSWFDAGDGTYEETCYTGHVVSWSEQKGGSWRVHHTDASGATVSDSTVSSGALAQLVHSITTDQAAPLVDEADDIENI